MNEAVRNNPDKFPDDYLFSLSNDELENLRTKFSTTNLAKTRVTPKAFTEKGLYMIATILKSRQAISATFAIIETFAKMRELTQTMQKLSQQPEADEQKALMHKSRQIFDAWQFASGLIKNANKSIILIDNYIDESVLHLLSKRKPGVSATIYTASVSAKLKTDLHKYNQQYDAIEVKIFNKSHDRFLIIDNDEIYHIGASLKDLGKKWFAFSKININPNLILNALQKK